MKYSPETFFGRGRLLAVPCRAGGGGISRKSWIHVVCLLKCGINLPQEQKAFFRGERPNASRHGALRALPPRQQQGTWRNLFQSLVARHHDRFGRLGMEKVLCPRVLCRIPTRATPRTSAEVSKGRFTACVSSYVHLILRLIRASQKRETSSIDGSLDVPGLDRVRLQSGPTSARPIHPHVKKVSHILPSHPRGERMHRV